MTKKLTTEYVKEFITGKFHNIKLKDDFEYKNSNAKISILCDIHGEQSISFSKLKSRSRCGCPKCGAEMGKQTMSRVWNYTEDEIKSKIYNKYGKDNVDLSKFSFKKVKEKSIVICKRHGREFLINSDELCKESRKHLCPSCRYSAVSKLLQRNIQKEDFLRLSKNIFGDVFLYDKLPDIITVKGKITITCKIHGDLNVNAETHLNGYGCKKCGTERARIKSLNDIKTMIEKCKVIFNNAYTYDKVVYDGIDKPVIITCPKHGDFKRTMYHHLHKKHKCPKCSKSVSGVESEWLRNMDIPDNDKCRQVRVRVDKKTFKVDGIIEETKTIYEFLGDYYHGNPNIYNSHDYNKKCHRTYGDLYCSTINKLNSLCKLGYKVIYIWESDYKKGLLPNEWKPFYN